MLSCAESATIVHRDAGSIAHCPFIPQSSHGAQAVHDAPMIPHCFADVLWTH
jgi:hypothetical protein